MLPRSQSLLLRLDPESECCSDVQQQGTLSRYYEIITADDVWESHLLRNLF
jgi:hypothetical protein